MNRAWTLVPALVLFLGLCFAACGGDEGEDPEPTGDVADVVEAEEVCYPSCQEKECGADGCGGYCGACEEGFSCNAAGQCEVLPTCEIVQEITCDDVIPGDTTGLPSELHGYSCDDYAGLGPDRVYIMTPAEDDHVTVELSAAVPGMRVMVLQSPCKEETCLESGEAGFEMDVEGKKKYSIVVDSQEGVEGSFTLSMYCHSTCLPDCDFDECGDDGCGGSCGTCPEAAPFCNEGLCETMACNDGICDASENCGSCPEDCPCPGDEVCFNGACCSVSCDGKDCGDDGCGGSCGECEVGKNCEAGACVAGGGLGCEALDGPGCNGCPCEACVCDLDPYCCDTLWDGICADECIQQCGGCGPVTCGDGECKPEEDEDCLSCALDCVCADGEVCLLGECCAPDCDGKECGDDGCGGQCGNCGINGICLDSLCCEKQCADLECGDDGCGGQCGNCGIGNECLDGKCYAQGAFCLNASPELLDFGAVKVGSLSSKTLVFNNCGLEVLDVVSVAIEEGGSEVIGLDTSELPQIPTPDDPLELAAGESLQLNVLFMPAEVSAVDVDGKPVPEASTISVQTSVGVNAAAQAHGVGLDPTCPVAVIECEEGPEVAPQTVLHLSGTSSTVIEGVVAGYQWVVLEQPQGSLAQLFPSDGVAEPTFAAGMVGLYKFQLEVWDVSDKMSCAPAVYEVVVLPDEPLYVELFWTTPGDPDETDSGEGAGSDLDLHFLHPWAAGPDIDGDGQPDGWFDDLFDCFWHQSSPDWGVLADPLDDPLAALSDADGGGPEILSYAVPANLDYRVGVHYWDDHGYGPAQAGLRVYISSQLVFEAPGVELQSLDMWDALLVHFETGTVEPVQDEGGYKITPAYVNPFFNP